jgi:hypothetical protein
MKSLGTIVDLTSFTFRVAKARARKIRTAIAALLSAVTDNPDKVPAKLVASFVGLIYSIAPCAHRPVSVMTRAIIDVLTSSLRSSMRWAAVNLKTLLSIFWAGTVKWTEAAHRQLLFWLAVNFEGSRHISQPTC